MDELQLLNLEHNLITRICHLSHLQHLFVLNLYDNQVSEMTGIEALSSLRILSLGKNRLVVSYWIHKQTSTSRDPICLSSCATCSWQHGGGSEYATDWMMYSVFNLLDGPDAVAEGYTNKQS